MKREIDLSQIRVPKGYGIQVFKSGLTTPISLVITPDYEFYYGQSGVIDQNGKLIKLTKNGEEIIADGFNSPLTGVTYYQGDFYVSHRGKITKVDKNGNKDDLIINLPSFGDHHNNRVEFGQDGKMYFGQGTATNSGVVGLDNLHWLKENPFFHDYSGLNINLIGKNFKTDYNGKQFLTGAFLPFGVSSNHNEQIKGIVRASGSVLRANPDGSELELVCSGLRNPFMVKFDHQNRLFCTNHGMDIRGSRPIANSPDEFRLIEFGKWYGWPDYTGGYPVTLPYFKPDDNPQPEFLLAYHPMKPPVSFVNYTPHSAITGFDFSNPAFGFDNDAFVAEFGAMDPGTTGGKLIPSVGHQISRVDLNRRTIQPFIYNTTINDHYHKGLNRPVDVVIRDNEMFIVDFGIHEHHEGTTFVKESGAIFKIYKK